MEEKPAIATHQIQSATLKNIQMQLQGPTAHGRAAHLYIVRFPAQQSYANHLDNRSTL